jgi:hypothetical protein
VDPELIRLLIAAGGLTGKPGSPLTSADVGRVFQPDLGVLTGTYTGREESEDDIIARAAPYLTQIRNNPEADEIAYAIAQDIESGLPFIQVKKRLRELTRSIPTQEAKDYMELAETLSKENINIKQELLKNKNKETFFSKSGLPEPSTPYDPEPMMGSVYESLLKRYAPYEVDPNANKLSKEAIEAKKNAPYRPYREGETKPELDAIRKELEEKRVVDPNAKWTPYWPGETDADVRRIAQERQLLKELAAGQGVKTFVPIRTELVNSQRAQRAKDVADVSRQLVAKAMQQRGAGSPLLDQLQQRMILQKVMENPAALKKLTNPGS